MTVGLCSLWCTGIDHRPAVLGDRTVSRLDLFAAADKLAKQIAGKRVAIFCTSSEREAVAFLAVMRASSPVVFPATNQSESLREINSAFDVLLTDEPVPDGIEYISLADVETDCRDTVLAQEKPVDSNLKMTFFTSGSTGKPKEIVKYFYQMDREIRVWESLLGAELQNAEVHSTVSHQHIYGLLFRLLWPLCAARPFRAEMAKSWEELSRQTSPETPFILVTSPTHLSRLAPLDREDVSVRPLLTFSAGGVLHNEYAQQAAEHLGRPVLEVYGSTETGAIARRFNKGSDDAWDLLPGTIIAQNKDKCLQVRSPFLENQDDILETGDLVTLTATGSFVLQGRADRVVKVEGKRVSLPRTEALLRNHPWINDVYAKMIGETRPVLGAVIVLSEEGAQFLAEQGNFRMGRSLRDHLKKFEDAVMCPRRWRFVDQIPRNAQGKIRPGDIDTLFEIDADGLAAQRPVFKNTAFIEIARETLIDTVNIRFRVPPDLDFFKGHFTESPLLPGVVQLHWATENSVQVFGLSGQPEKIEKLKFKEFLFPGSEAVLTLQSGKEGIVTFLYHSVDRAGNKVEHSSGTLRFQEGV